MAVAVPPAGSVNPDEQRRVVALALAAKERVQCRAERWCRFWSIAWLLLLVWSLVGLTVAALAGIWVLMALHVVNIAVQAWQLRRNLDWHRELAEKRAWFDELQALYGSWVA